jgi:hypothetical protein
MSRETTIQVRVSHEEKARIVENAEDFGVSPSDYLRSQALFARPDAPVRYETEHDRENKAKVREAVENEEPYEVKIEPGTSRPDHETWVKQETIRLKARMSTRRAEAEAEKNWEKLPLP